MLDNQINTMEINSTGEGGSLALMDLLYDYRVVIRFRRFGSLYCSWN